MTAQAHEKLIVDGEQTSMAFCPDLPEDEPRIVRTDRPYRITSCWRGYVGTWEIKDNNFYLKHLSGGLKLTTPPLFANWFNGVLRVPRGEMLEYIHMGFGTVYEQELHIKIEKGHVTKTKVIDNSKKTIDRQRHNLDSFPGLENLFDGDNL